MSFPIFLNSRFIFGLMFEQYQMKLLKPARNEAKQTMYEIRSNIVTYLNVLKEQLSKGDYDDTLITITDNTKEKHFISTTA